jgi:alanine dehydrogenase
MGDNVHHCFPNDPRCIPTMTKMEMMHKSVYFALSIQDGHAAAQWKYLSNRQFVISTVTYLSGYAIGAL